MRARLSDRSNRRLRTTATILATAMVIAPATALATHGFSDVESGDFFHAAVDWMKDNRVTVGCNPPNNTRYCPNDPVTRGEMAVFLERLDSQKVFLRPGDDAVDGGDADTVDGKHASDFLGVTAKAANANLLDGIDSADLTQRMFASIGADGDLVHGHRAVSVTRTGPGLFEVLFDRPVLSCVYSATRRYAGDAPGFISVEPLSTFTPEGVSIRTYDTAGTAASRSFHLIVVC